MSTGPATPLQASPLTPPTVSLLTSAQIVIEESNRWENGFEIKGEGCGNALAHDDCGTVAKCAFPSSGLLNKFIPYTVYSSDQCSTWGIGRDGEIDERASRLLRNLAASESFVLEQELWSDTLGLSNPKIASSSAITYATALPVSKAIAQMSDAAGDLARGGRIMFHMRPYQLFALVEARLARREGNVWLTPLDDIIVPGRGYAGTGPAGQVPTASEEWIYATGIVQIRRGEILEIKDKTSVINRQTNDVVLLSERKAIASFDPNCVHIAAKVTR
jgi:hypothetical protein